MAKCDFIDGGAEFDVVTEEFRELGWTAFPRVSEPNMCRKEAKSGQLPAHAHKRSHPEFDLMPIEVTANPDIVEHDADVFAVYAFLRDAFVDDRGVVRAALQRVDQNVGRREHIVKQTDFPQVRDLRQVEAQKLVPKRIGDKVQEPDLIADPQADARIIHLFDGQVRGFEQRRHSDTCGFCPAISEPAHDSGSAGKPAQPEGDAIIHDSVLSGL